MNELADFAEGHQVVAGREAQNREHRMRPENPATSEIPVPETAAPRLSAVSMRLRTVHRSRRPRVRGWLANERGKAQDQQHETGWWP